MTLSRAHLLHFLAAKWKGRERSTSMQSVGKSMSEFSLQHLLRAFSLNYGLSLSPLAIHPLTHIGSLHDASTGIQPRESCGPRTFLEGLHLPGPQIQISKAGPWSGRIGRIQQADEGCRGTGSPLGRTGHIHPRGNSPTPIKESPGGFHVLAK